MIVTTKILKLEKHFSRAVVLYVDSLVVVCCFVTLLSAAVNQCIHLVRGCASNERLLDCGVVLYSISAVTVSCRTLTLFPLMKAALSSTSLHWLSQHVTICCIVVTSPLSGAQKGEGYGARNYDKYDNLFNRNIENTSVYNRMTIILYYYWQLH